MPDFSYIQHFTFNAAGERVNDSVMAGTLPDQTGDDHYSLGEIITFREYFGTVTVSGIVLPVFLRGDRGITSTTPGPSG